MTDPVGHSAASAGPAGPDFEVKVGASYLVSMLAGVAPRGLPGTTVERIQFQRGPEGYPLDDIVVHTHEPAGTSAVLEIQCKRSLSAAPGDPLFEKAMDQVSRAIAVEGFSKRRHELAIAFARPNNAALLGPYPDVLIWARNLGTAAEFFERLNRQGSASASMRTFVTTVRNHLRTYAGFDDEERTFRVLGRMQLLMFDFTSTGSSNEEVAHERCATVLHQQEASKAAALWRALISLALETAASGGEFNRSTLSARIAELGFTLAGDRRYSVPRAVIAEDAQHAMDEIRDSIGNLHLLRSAPLQQVREAARSNRYIEIRGEGGVGKSALLKHLGQQLARESPVLFCSPGRIVPGGSTALRNRLGLEGTVRELMLDLASTGGTALLVDGLENFNTGEQKTVADLIRVAASIPGFAVFVTTRHTPDDLEAAWLPTQAINTLGRAEPVIVSELNDIELRTLAAGNPTLEDLLAPDGPARDVLRNLYRLAYLTQRPSSAYAAMRSEVDLADQWWRAVEVTDATARRKRRRLLHVLAEQAFERAEPLDVKGQSSRTIAGLIQVGILRDLDNDRVAFRHDVLREWAIGQLLAENANQLTRLPLRQPAPAALARGLELAARRSLEKSKSPQAWHELLDRVSREGNHGSWRRMVLLATIRSELGVELLMLTQPIMLADDGALLRELLGIVLAVEVEPATRYLGNYLSEAKAEALPSSFTVPRIRSWARLVTWLLLLDRKGLLPQSLIPLAVDVLSQWLGGTGGSDPFCGMILGRLYAWLVEIEDTRHPADSSRWRPPFDGRISTPDFEGLEAKLRRNFVGRSERRPDLAVQYLRRLLDCEHCDDNIAFELLKSSGTLAQAAPAELADLTARVLKAPPSDPEEDAVAVREPFNYIDHRFIEPSPSQGPFLSLLTASPTHGLRLVRELVDHAIAHYRRLHRWNDSHISLQLPSGTRSFPFVPSYYWSRQGTVHVSLTSALMALETWGHQRIERGDTIDSVLADILVPGVPAAHVAVAVDLILTHWPATAEAAIPFVACPELVVLDRKRRAYDQMEKGRSPAEAVKLSEAWFVTRAMLQAQQSRHRTLLDLIAQYACGFASNLRERLTALLRDASLRCGPPGTDTDWADPAFVATHALNAVNPDHYRKIEIEAGDGSTPTEWQYVPPPTEAAHHLGMQQSLQEMVRAVEMEQKVQRALEDPAKSSSELAARAVVWAQAMGQSSPTEDPEPTWIRKHCELAAALLAVRDGDQQLRETQRVWARGIFIRALEQAPESRGQLPESIRYNPLATAFLGLAYLVMQENATSHVRSLLEAAAHPSLGAAPAFSEVVIDLSQTDPRLPRSVVRCAFEAAVHGVVAWNTSEEARQTIRAADAARRDLSIEAELAWLRGERPEPAWPTFPPKQSRRAATSVDEAGAAIWLLGLSPLTEETRPPWITDLIRTYVTWTGTANGVGLPEGYEPADGRPGTWNRVFFKLLPATVPGLDRASLDTLVIGTLTTLPEEAYFDATAISVLELDTLYFEGNLGESEWLYVRTCLAEHLMRTRGWRWLRLDRSARNEIHLGPAVARMFFNLYEGFVQPAVPYLRPAGMPRLLPFLPVLEKLATDAPSLWTGLFLLDLLKVAPDASHLATVINVVDALMAAFPGDQGIWVNQELASRFCYVLEQIRAQDAGAFQAATPARMRLDRLLTALVALGVPEAARFEQALSTAPIV